MTARVKLCMLGDGGVGKTAFTIQFCSHIFVEEYDPTIEDSYRKQIDVDGSQVVVDILDTAGQEEFKALRDQWIVGCEGFCLLYSIINRQSFDLVSEFVSQVEQAKDLPRSSISMILIGNKCDLEEQREVGRSEGEELAASLGGEVTFYEASAKSRINVEEPIVDLVRRTRSKQAPAKPPRSGGCMML